MLRRGEVGVEGDGVVGGDAQAHNVDRGGGAEGEAQCLLLHPGRGRALQDAGGRKQATVAQLPLKSAKQMQHVGLRPVRVAAPAAKHQPLAAGLQGQRSQAGGSGCRCPPSACPQGAPGVGLEAQGVTCCQAVDKTVKGRTHRRVLLHADKAAHLHAEAHTSLQPGGLAACVCFCAGLQPPSALAAAKHACCRRLVSMPSRSPRARETLSLRRGAICSCRRAAADWAMRVAAVRMTGSVAGTCCSASNALPLLPTSSSHQQLRPRHRRGRLCKKKSGLLNAQCRLRVLCTTPATRAAYIPALLVLLII